MALKSGTVLPIPPVGHPRHVNLETGQAWKRETARLAHMLLPTGNPSDLSGKLQGENITVTSEPYFVEKSMQLRKQIWIGQIFLAMKKIT